MKTNIRNLKPISNMEKIIPNEKTNNEYLKHKIRYFINDYKVKLQMDTDTKNIVSMAYDEGFITALKLVLEDLEQ